MKITLSIFNKPQIVAAFLPEAVKIAELFGCAIQIKCDNPILTLPAGLDFWPVKTGSLTELEICVQGDAASEALSAMRRCMSQCFSAVNHQMN